MQPHFNGEPAIVLGWLPPVGRGSGPSGRYVVGLLRERKTLAVRPVNIVVLSSVAAPSDEPARPGDIVVMDGLQQRPELNGHFALLGGWLADSQRYRGIVPRCVRVLGYCICTHASVRERARACASVRERGFHELGPACLPACLPTWIWLCLHVRTQAEPSPQPPPLLFFFFSPPPFVL